MKIEEVNYSEKIAREIVDIVINEPGTSDNLCRMTNEQKEEMAELIDRLGDKSRQKLMCDAIKISDGRHGAQRLMKSINQRRRKLRYRIAITIGSSVAAMLVAVVFFMEKPDNGSKKDILTRVESKPLLITKDGRYDLDQVNDSISNLIRFSSKNAIEYRSVTAIAEIEYNEIILPPNYTYRVTFSDGTKVVLNAGSTLKYPVTFSDSTRTVELIGEGYFTVAKSDKPFIVKSNRVEVKVFGTIFNVRSYSPTLVETVLVEGAVGLSFDGKDQKMILPNQMALCNTETKNIKIEEIHTINHISWVDGDFHYRNTSLSNIVEDIAKWYGVSLSSNIDLTVINISFYAKRSQRIDTIFKLIEQVTDVKFIKEREGKYSIEREE